MRAEVVPRVPRYYEYVKYFEGNPNVLIARLSEVCKTHPKIVYSGEDARIFSFDCGGVIVDVVVADRGATMYVCAPGIRKIEAASVVLGTLLGGLAAFVGGYLGGVFAGIFAGLAVYAGLALLLRRFLLENDRNVLLFEKIKGL